MKTPSADIKKKVLTYDLSEPLCGTTAAAIDIHAGSGNLTIDRLTGGGQELASGTLEYVESQGQPTHSMNTNGGQDTFTLRASGKGQPWFRFPWAACNGATEWQIHLNPDVQSDIKAHSDGGNVKLDLSGMAVTRVSADTGGGNLEVVLPDHAASLSVMAKTGAGNVTVDIGNGITGSNVVTATSGAGNVVVRVPSGIAGCIHAGSGLGKGTLDPRFSKIDGNTYQSPDYDIASDRVEITLKSGVGRLSIEAK